MPAPFCHLTKEELFKKLNARAEGLSHYEAAKRLKIHGQNLIKPRKRSSEVFLFFSQFKSPLILLLIFAATLSFVLSDRTDASIIMAIVVASGLLGYFQERSAVHAVEKLIEMVQVKATVLRDGKESEIAVEHIVPGDIVLIHAGDLIPGDCLVLEAKDLFVDEATLTGETFAVEKKEGRVPENSPLSKCTNCLFMGSHAVTGSGKALVVATGTQTEFGKISEHLKFRPPETAFERGVRFFGYFLLEVTLVLVLGIFALNIYFGRPMLESFLFALALAVGLTPQLLPAIVSINLAHGAKKMAKKHVIVKRLSSIENFGSMDVLCADKTGTLTKGHIELEGARDCAGNESEKVTLFGYLNASMQTGYANPIDKALLRKEVKGAKSWRKLDEVPYDFVRKRISVLAAHNGSHLILSKGAFIDLLKVCSFIESPDGTIAPLPKDQLLKLFEEYSKKGIRTLGVAYRDLGNRSTFSYEDEKEMVFAGFLLFSDHLKPDIAKTVAELKRLGVSLKVITGDNHLIAHHVAQQIGLDHVRVLTGHEIQRVGGRALIRKVQDYNVFAEVEPNQKERLILALRKAGHVVGFLGDGINDSTALHAADVGITVDQGADVAKEVADIVLLDKDLSVLQRGVEEGRRTFGNTLKYIFMATSANFGNMFSMAGTSLFLSFLPMLPKQILLTNLMTDFPEMAIATDNVDRSMVERPLKWDLGFIRRFMIVFGLVSSIFDFVTFGVLLFVLNASVEEFRTGWFMESVISASLIVLVVRTRKPFFKSNPSSYLTAATFGIVLIAFFLPLTPLATLFNFTPLPPLFSFTLVGIVALYITAAEIAKKLFYRKLNGIRKT